MLEQARIKTMLGLLGGQGVRGRSYHVMAHYDGEKSLHTWSPRSSLMDSALKKGHK